MFATDKTPVFSLVDLKVSPTKHHHLVIGALQPNHIEETFNLSKTKEGKPLSDYIKFGSDTIRSEFFRRLYVATGGLPRCIHYALEALCIEGPVQVNSENIAKALYLGYSHMIRTGNISNHFAVPRTLILDIDYYNAYVNLLGCAALKVPLNKESLVPVGDDKFPLLRLVDLFTFSLDKHEDKFGAAQVLLKISEWTLKNFRDISPVSVTSNDVRLPFLETLLSFPELVGPGSTLEYLVRTTLLSRLSHLVAFGKRKRWARCFHSFNFHQTSQRSK
jgi:hypothetical protein